MTVRITVRVKPRASTNRVEGLDADGVILVRVTAAPVGGAANEAVIRTLAKALGLRRSQVTLIRGARSRNKVVEVEGLSQEEIVKSATRAQPRDT